MNNEHLYDPVGDVIADGISRELPVRLTALERLEIVDLKAAAEDELAAHQNRMADVQRELTKQGEAIARRITEMGAALRERQQPRGGLLRALGQRPDRGRPLRHRPARPGVDRRSAAELAEATIQRG